MPDELAAINRKRWGLLARAGCEYTRPLLHLTPESARELVDPGGLMGEVAGQRVLGLAAGGGQQSVAFALLGAEVTIVDLTPEQLTRDREALAHYGLSERATLIEGDMRALPMLADASFDAVWQAHSINFVPDPRSVFAEVSRLLRRGGRYRLELTYPAVHGTWQHGWNGAYLLAPQRDEEVVEVDATWRVATPEGEVVRVPSPREFRHTLPTLLNGLAEHGLRLLRCWQGQQGDPDADPGSWEHFEAYAGPWLGFWCERA